MSKKKTTETKKLPIDQVLKSVQDSKSSIFSKDDVIELLKELDPNSGNVSSGSINKKEIMKRIHSIVVDTVGDMDRDSVVDINSFDYSISGNEISVEDFRMDEDYIVDSIVGEINDNWEDIFEEE